MYSGFDEHVNVCLLVIRSYLKFLWGPNIEPPSLRCISVTFRAWAVLAWSTGALS